MTTLAVNPVTGTSGACQVFSGTIPHDETLSFYQRAREACQWLVQKEGLKIEDVRTLSPLEALELMPSRQRVF